MVKARVRLQAYSAGSPLARTVWLLGAAYGALLVLGCDRSGEVPPAVPQSYGPPPPRPYPASPYAASPPAAPYPAAPAPSGLAPTPGPVPTMPPPTSSPSQAQVNGAAFAIPVDAPGERSSCTDRATYAAATMNAALNAGREMTCSKDTDCVLVPDATGCDGGCQAGIHTSVAGKYHAFYEKVRRDVCGNYVKDGCPHRAPKCASRTAICKQGVCGASIAGSTMFGNGADR